MKQFVAHSGLFHTLPEDINEVDVYYDISYKLQSFIHASCQPIPDSTNVFISSLHKVKNQLPIEDYWVINKMRSMDRGTAVVKTMSFSNSIGINDGFFKQHRGTSACILEVKNNIQSTMYNVHNAPGNKTY